MKDMKMIKVFLLMFAVVFSADVMAQAKFGHINFSQALELMPEMSNVKAELSQRKSEFDQETVMMKNAYLQKSRDYDNSAATLSDLLRRTKENELKDISKRITLFEQKSEQEMLNLQKELMSPVINELRMAIENVSRERGYIYVLDSSPDTRVILYTESDDLLPLVKSKLGI